MATIRSGNKSALIIVDVQVGVMKGTWDTARVIGNIARTVDRARTRRAPVIWVQHSEEQMAIGSADWQWVPELVPQEGEPRIYKKFESSFENTELEKELSSRGITQVVLAGAATNWCIRATAYGALDRGYDLTIVKDAHTTKPMELENGFKIDAEQVVQELNAVMRWVSYPGRTCSTAAAEQVEFATA